MIRMMDEYNFYLEILEEYSNLNNNVNARETWKVNSIIKLMNISRALNNDVLLQNGLLIILNLMNHLEMKMEGKNSRDLIERERDLLVSILQKEMN